MNRFLSALAVVAGLVVLTAISALVYQRATYYSEHNALLAEIRKHPDLTIVDHWRHEDLSLEDFGFAIRSKRATAFLNITDGSGIREPHDRAVGIALKLPREMRREGNTVYSLRRFIRFDSAEWQRRRLPQVATIADVLANFDEIAHSLLSDPPPALLRDGGSDFFIDLEVGSGRPRSRGPARTESKLKFW